MRKYILCIFILFSTLLNAQIGEHRNTLSAGANFGYAFTNVGFTPKVTQSKHGGVTGGVSVRYMSEKYFKTYCSIYGELNYLQMGWKENIVDIDENKVINPVSGLAEEYSRTINYIEMPIFAQLAWGKEDNGCKFFVQAGPKIGYCISESTSTNFDISTVNENERANKEMTQYAMDVENRFDYGIAAGMGIEYSMSRIGHFLLEMRYNYGLGNLYGDSKRDYFSKSNNNGMIVKLIYMFDISK